MLRRPRTSSQHATRSGHSDDDEDEGVPASYHTVSLQVSQDVSMAAFTSFLPSCTEAGTWVEPGKVRAKRRPACSAHASSTSSRISLIHNHLEAFAW